MRGALGAPRAPFRGLRGLARGSLGGFSARRCSRRRPWGRRREEARTDYSTFVVPLRLRRNSQAASLVFKRLVEEIARAKDSRDEHLRFRTLTRPKRPRETNGLVVHDEARSLCRTAWARAEIGPASVRSISCAFHSEARSLRGRGLAAWSCTHKASRARGRKRQTGNRIGPPKAVPQSQVKARPVRLYPDSPNLHRTSIALRVIILLGSPGFSSVNGVGVRFGFLVYHSAIFPSRSGWTASSFHLPSDLLFSLRSESA